MSDRILIVDDSRLNLKLMSDVLESDGFQVDRADSGEQALAILEQGIPDLIVVDILLPVMDGLTLTRLVRSNARLRGVRIVAITGLVASEHENDALAAGCDGFVRKPIDTRALPQLLRAFMRCK